jgi:hypothetical protein
MPVEELEVGQIRMSIEHSWTHVIDLDLGPIQERSTPGTPPVLSFEQDGDPAHRQWVLTQPLGPVDEVTVERAGGAAHFHVALDRCIRVVHQAQTGWC